MSVKTNDIFLWSVHDLVLKLIGLTDARIIRLIAKALGLLLYQTVGSQLRFCEQ